jgi:hypothetical protein
MEHSHHHDDVVAGITDLQAALRGDAPTQRPGGATVHELAWFRQALAPEAQPERDEEATVTPLPRRDDLATRIWRPRQPVEDEIRRLRLAERVSDPDPDVLAERAREATRKVAELQRLANRRLGRDV